MIKHRGGDAKLPVDKGPDTEEISDHGVDGGGLPEGPGDSGGVVAPGEGGTPGGGVVHKGKGGLLKDKGGKFQIRIGDTTCRVGKADQICPDVRRPGQAPDVVNTILVGVDPHAPSPQPGGVSKANIRGDSLHNFRQVGGALRHLCTQLLPEGDVGVKASGEIGSGAGSVVGRREGTLDMIEVAHSAGYSEVHRA